LHCNPRVARPSQPRALRLFPVGEDQSTSRASLFQAVGLQGAKQIHALGVVSRQFQELSPPVPGGCPAGAACTCPTRDSRRSSRTRLCGRICLKTRQHSFSAPQVQAHPQPGVRDRPQGNRTTNSHAESVDQPETVEAHLRRAFLLHYSHLGSRTPRLRVSNAFGVVWSLDISPKHQRCDLLQHRATP